MHMHTNPQTDAPPCDSLPTYVCMYVCMYVWSLAGNHMEERDYRRPCICMRVCVCVCVYACVYACVCVFVHIHTCAHISMIQPHFGRFPLPTSWRDYLCMRMYVCVHTYIHTYAHKTMIQPLFWWLPLPTSRRDSRRPHHTVTKARFLGMGTRNRGRPHGRKSNYLHWLGSLFPPG